MRIDPDNTITNDQRHLAKCRQRVRKVVPVTQRRRVKEINQLNRQLLDRLFAPRPKPTPRLDGALRCFP